MSDFLLTLVLQFKTSKIINDMAKVQIKSEKVTPFGGIFPVRELFSRYMAPVMPDGVRGRWALTIHNHVCSGKAIVRWRGKLQNVVYITICCGF